MKPLAAVVAARDLSVDDRPPGTERLRRRLAMCGGGPDDALSLDLLEDDLHEAECALAALGSYLSRVRRAVQDGRAGGRDLVALALAGDGGRVETLESSLAALRRRVGRLGRRLG